MPNSASPPSEWRWGCALAARTVHEYDRAQDHWQVLARNSRRPYSGGSRLIKVGCRDGERIPFARLGPQWRSLWRSPVDSDASGTTQQRGPDIASECAIGPCQIGAPAVEGLAGALARGESQVRWEAARALKQINDRASVPALVSALDDPDSGVRWISVEGLSTTGRPSLVPLLTALATRPDSIWLRQGAHHILKSLSAAGLKREVAPVIAAREDIEPAFEVPAATHEALAPLSSAS